MESTIKTNTGEKNNNGSENNMDLKLTKFLKLLLILFVISTISWYLALITPSDNLPFLIGSISSTLGAFLIIWFLVEFKDLSKDDIEVIAKE